jgi:hypothetical protein
LVEWRASETGSALKTQVPARDLKAQVVTGTERRVTAPVLPTMALWEL